MKHMFTKKKQTNKKLQSVADQTMEKMTIEVAQQTKQQPINTPPPTKKELVSGKKVINKPIYSELVFSHCREVNNLYNSNLVLQQQLPRTFFEKFLNRKNIRPIDSYDVATIFCTATDYPTDVKKMKSMHNVIDNFKRDNPTAYCILATTYFPPKEYAEKFHEIIYRQWNGDNYKQYYRNLYSAVLLAYEEGFEYSLVTNPENQFYANNVVGRCQVQMNTTNKLFMTHTIDNNGIMCDVFFTNNEFWLNAGLHSYIDVKEFEADDSVEFAKEFADKYSFIGEAYEFNYVQQQFTFNVNVTGYNIEEIVDVQPILLGHYIHY